MITLDLVIRGGLVVDGTGAQGTIADIGIAGGRYAEIGGIAATGALPGMLLRRSDRR